MTSRPPSADENGPGSRDQRWRSQQGIALIVALLMMLVVSTLAASVIFVADTDVLTTTNYRTLLQARYAAEAGAQVAANWLAYTYTAPASTSSLDLTVTPVRYNGNPVVLSATSGVTENYPDAPVQSAFRSALQDVPLPGLLHTSYSVTATLVSMVPGSTSRPVQTWQITSQGTITGVRPGSVQVVLTIERPTAAQPGYAIFATSSACAAINFSSSGFTDSFDSSAGTYAATQQNSGGDVGTNGNMKMSGSSAVYGNLWSPAAGTGSCSSGSPTALTDGSSLGVMGTVSQLPGAYNPPVPDPPSPTPPTTNFSVPSSPYTLAPGSYGNITASGGKNVHLSAGVYNVNSLTWSGGSIMTVDSGPVVFNIMGTGASKAMNLSGGTVSNMTGIPANLTFNYGGSLPIDISSGGTQAFEVINAPNSPLTISGGGNIYGALIAFTVTNSGGSSVHYDRALSGASGGANPYRPIGFSWTKY